MSKSLAQIRPLELLALTMSLLKRPTVCLSERRVSGAVSRDGAVGELGTNARYMRVESVVGAKAS